MFLNRYFDEIYCINLDSRTDRWERCQQLFLEHDCEVKRLSAVDGSLLTPVEGVTLGEIGCAESHLKALRLAAEAQGPTLILEDDVEFVSNLQERFAACLLDLPPDWDMFYLGGNHIHALNPITGLVGRMHHTYATQSYAVMPSFAKFLLSEITNTATKIDVEYAIRHDAHSCYATWPSLSWQRAGFSDVRQCITDYRVLVPTSR